MKRTFKQVAKKPYFCVYCHGFHNGMLPKACRERRGRIDFLTLSGFSRKALIEQELAKKGATQ